MSPPLDLASNIKAVTVYRRGALVTREAELTPGPEGFPARVQLVGLPLGLHDSSVRVAVRGAGVVAGDLKVSLAVPAHDEGLAPPTNTELDAAKLELALALAAIAELERAKARVERLEPIARATPEEGKAPAPSPTAARLELLGFRRARGAAIAEELVRARAGLRTLEQELAALRERDRLASTARNTRAHELRKAAILELASEGEAAPGERSAAIVELRYFVPGARWAPSYTVRLDRSMSAAELELRAMVGQSTGEDWEGVALTLSTASPQQWTELPELESRRIGRRQPPPAKTGWRPPPLGADALYADYDRGLGEGPPDPPPAPASTTGSFDLDDELDDELDDAPFEEELSWGSAASPMPAAAPYPAQDRETSKRSKVRASPSRGAVPMAPPGAMLPAPKMAAPARRSGGIGSLVGGAIDGLSSAFASEGGGGAASNHAVAPSEPELLAGRELLDYGRLCLRPASSSTRGALRRIELRIHYQQTLSEELDIAVAFSQITEAREWAKLLETETPPEGHSWPASEGGFDYAYVAAAPVDLRSTGGFHSLPIDLREAPARPRYVSVPRESQDVFRIVKLSNPFAAPLLPGPVDVYVDGKFMLASALELTPREGRIELGIGVEQGIKIARNVRFAEESSGMFKRASQLHHTLALEIQNHLADTALVEIRERLPVVAEAHADELEVELESVEPSWEDYEPKRPGAKLEGGRRWRVEVPANAKRELTATYVIKLPTANELVGGNRRES